MGRAGQEAATQSVLDDIIKTLSQLPQDQLVELANSAFDDTAIGRWVPNPGPQTRAFESEADELFYGGQAGGGKTDLVAGLAVQKHTRSLILRRFNDDARDLSDRVMDIIGDRNGFNGQLLRYSKDGKLIEFGGCKEEKDKQRYKGRPHDLIAFDELGDFLRSQYEFIVAWNRSANPSQRCRVVCTGNPPTTPEGLWVIERWAAWLDPKHPNPAEDGELRWYTTDEDGKEIEVSGRGPHMIGGEQVYARSRTFIRARLEDNPDLTQTSDYAATLAALPPALRAAYRDGRFDASLEDDPWQCIPTHWVIEAQQRWTERPPHGVPMCAIGVDVAQGGADSNVLACRYDGWYAPLIEVPGSETPLGKDVGGLIVATRKDGAIVIIDAGGGYAGAPVRVLKENDIPVRGFKGGEGTTERTRDASIKLHNKRTAAYWRFREALDPSQEWGSPISLPPDPVLLSDLCAPSYSVETGVLKLEDAKMVKKRIGRSPDKGTAVVLAWSEGVKAITHHYFGAPGEMGLKYRTQRPTVKFGRQNRRQRNG